MLKNGWKSVVGLEVHAQINTLSKLFSGSSTKFTSPVNTNVTLFDASTPGTLPVLNRKCVEYGVMTALALNCRVNPISTFDRKHYFYADIPAGYQMTQQRHPLANDGGLKFLVFSPGVHKTPYMKEVRIKQVQLEQDSGKSLHDHERSLVDLNRAGVPLMEVVFEPDLQDGEEAASLLKELVIILQRIGSCTCKMEEGALRVDANVSIHKEGEPLGTRTEIKNIGSIRGVAGAIKYEVSRQIEEKEKGHRITNETRAWDAVTKTTVAMRDKEETQDYRYMPEPNLPPLHIAMGPVTQGCVNADVLKDSLPELPAQTRARLQNEYSLTLEQTVILVSEDCLLKAFEDGVLNRHLNGVYFANFLINDYITQMHKNGLEPSELNISHQYLGDLVEFLQSRMISRGTARLVLDEIIKGSRQSPQQIIEAGDLYQITDEVVLRQLCQKVVDQNPKLLEQYRKGKTKVFRAFMGAIGTESQQQADMEKCNNLLKQLLDEKVKK